MGLLEPLNMLVVHLIYLLWHCVPFYVAYQIIYCVILIYIPVEHFLLICNILCTSFTGNSSTVFVFMIHWHIYVLFYVTSKIIYCYVYCFHNIVDVYVCNISVVYQACPNLSDTCFL